MNIEKVTIPANSRIEIPHGLEKIPGYIHVTPVGNLPIGKSFIVSETVLEPSGNKYVERTFNVSCVKVVTVTKNKIILSNSLDISVDVEVNYDVE